MPIKQTFKCPICGGKCLLHEVAVTEKRVVQFSDDGTMKLSDNYTIKHTSAPEVFRCVKCNEKYTLSDIEAIRRGQYESIIISRDMFNALLAKRRSCTICKHITEEYRCGRTGEYVGFDHLPCKYLVFNDITYGGCLSGMCTNCQHSTCDRITYRWSCAKRHNMYEKSVVGKCESHVSLITNQTSRARE